MLAERHPQLATVLQPSMKQALELANHAVVLSPGVWSRQAGGDFDVNKKRARLEDGDILTSGGRLQKAM